ncbi:MAG: hypothetical protein IKH58_06500 [Bacteroidales bacterium]|jgi:hypothetical protein|nr:hypothetical protein [Bacteroidales bacterium]
MKKGTSIIPLIAILMAMVSLSQFSGYSKRRIFVYLVVTSVFWFILLVIIFAFISYLMMPK